MKSRATVYILIEQISCRRALHIEVHGRAVRQNVLKDQWC